MLKIQNLLKTNWTCRFISDVNIHFIGALQAGENLLDRMDWADLHQIILDNTSGVTGSYVSFNNNAMLCRPEPVVGAVMTQTGEAMSSKLI